MKIRFLCAAILCLGANVFAQASKPGTIGFRGKFYEAAQLPAEVGAAAKAAATLWAPWGKTHGYRLDLDPSRRVLLVSSKGNVDADMLLVVKTIAFFDTIFAASVTPAPAEANGGGSGASKAAGTDSPDDVIPEDPETPPPGAPKTLPPDKGEVAKADSKLPEFVPDSQTAVMLVVKNAADYSSVLDFVASLHPYLADWKAEALLTIGFALEEPLCGSYNENSPGQEEWSPSNELVHRTMSLLVLRRFSRQPFWLQTGLSWCAELAVDKSIYCMPYRSGFVGIGEHSGWLSALNSIYAKHLKEPLQPQEFVMKRGTWDDKLSKTALGLADYLSKLNPRALAAMMEELRRSADENGRTTRPDGTWTKIRDYEVPGEQQKGLLERHFGNNVLRDVIVYWTSGAIEPVK